MNASEVVKLALLGALALLLWSWLRSGAHLNLGPGETAGYPVGGQAGANWFGGFIPFGAGKRGGITFNANVPWNLGQ